MYSESCALVVFRFLFSFYYACVMFFFFYTAFGSSVKQEKLLNPEFPSYSKVITAQLVSIQMLRSVNRICV